MLPCASVLTAFVFGVSTTMFVDFVTMCLATFMTTPPTAVMVALQDNSALQSASSRYAATVLAMRCVLIANPKINVAALQMKANEN